MLLQKHMPGDQIVKGDATVVIMMMAQTIGEIVAALFWHARFWLARLL